MRYDPNKSRANKFEKRRKNTKRLTYLVIAAIVLVVVLIFILFLSGGEDKKEDSKSPTENTEETEKQDPDDEDEAEDEFIKNDDESEEEKSDEKNDENKESKDDEDKDEDKDEDNDNDDVKTKSVKSSDDNVAEAFTGNWKPIGTEQSGPHTVNYDDGSQDRKEMEEAATVATGIDDMTVWWLSRAGDQKVEATISNNKDQSEIYRVNMEWVDEKGWKPTKVEMLKENDKK